MFQKLGDGSILNKQVFGVEKTFDLTDLRQEIDEADKEGDQQGGNRPSVSDKQKQTLENLVFGSDHDLKAKVNKLKSTRK